MICGKRGDSKFEEKWQWKGSNMDQIKEYKYLGYKVRNNGKQERPKIYMTGKGMIVICGE